MRGSGYLSVAVPGTFRAAEYGAKAQIGQVAVHRHAAAGLRQRRDGLQRLGGHGHGAVPATPTSSCSSRRRGRSSACRSLPIVMRIDYRHLPAAGRHLDGARRGRRSRWWPCSSARRSTARAAGSASAGSASSRRSSRRSSSSSSSRRCSSGAWTGSTTCAYALLPIGARRSACVVGLILLEPDFGTAVSIARDRRA